MKRILFLLCLFLLISIPAIAQQETPPAIVTFTSELTTITVPEAEAGQKTTRLTWTSSGMKADHRLVLFAYEIGTWVQLAPAENETLQANGSLEIPVRHPLNFNPPTYRLVIMNKDNVIISESTTYIPYALEYDPNADISETAAPVPLQPEIVTFTTTQTTIEANKLVYDEPVIPVSWQIAHRTPSSNLIFEQVFPDGTTRTVDFPRGNLWVSSVGSGTVGAFMPDSGSTVTLRLRIADLSTNATLDESSVTLSITGSVSTRTPTPQPRPTNTTQPNTANNNPAPTTASGNNPAPVVNAGTGGGFELGGHVAGFGFSDQMRSSGMNWAKKQIRWGRGEGTGAAAGAINEAHANGFKVLLGIVGYRDQMADYEAYTNEFAAYLGQVAALGPDAIEVWNEPNIDREWQNGAINGASYTQMLAKAYNAIKAANPNVMVISGAPAPTGYFGGGCAAAGCDDNVFLRQMANAGAASYMDCIGAHYNEGIISPDQTSGDPRGGHYSRYFWGMLNLYYNTFGGARKVCWTELGYLTGEGYGPVPSNFSWAGSTTLGQHAEWLGRAAALSRSSGKVRLMIVWNVDFRVYTDDPQGGYAIVRPDGQCPACGTLGAAMQ